MSDSDFELDGSSLDLDDIIGDLGEPAGGLKEQVEATKLPEKPAKKSTKKASGGAANIKLPATSDNEPIGGKPGTSVVFFDVETIPDESRMDSFGLEPLPPIPEVTHASNCPNGADLLKGTKEQIIAGLEAVVAPADYLQSLVALEAAGKKRKGVFDVIKAAGKVRDEAIEAHEARRTLLSVTPEFCRIVSLAAAIDERPIQCSVVGEDDGAGGVITERHLLQVFWDGIASGALLCGYGILNFDLPVIFWRSMFLGIRPPRKIDLTPWKGDVLDMYEKRFPNGSRHGIGKLKFQAAVCGIDIPAGDVDGSQVEELFKSGRLAELREYNASDVEISRTYYKKFKGFYW